MAPKQKPQYRFSSSRTLASGRYHHLNVIIKERTAFDHKKLLEISWQGDPDHPHWYAAKVAVEIKYSDRWAMARQLVNSLIRWLEKGQPFPNSYDICNLTPELLAEWLQKRRIGEVAYDPRLSEDVELDQIQRPELKRWMDNFRVMGTDGCTTSVLAETEEEARHLMISEFTRLVSDNTYGRYDKVFAKWLTFDRPVLLDTHASINGRDFRPLAEKLNLEWVEKEEEASA